MAVNPSLGHLYHDFNISNAYTVLDAQEVLRTRQRNAREKRQLEKYTERLEKAKAINKRRLEQDELEIRNNLKDIRLRTPTLYNGLKQESIRMSRGFSAPAMISRSLCSSTYPISQISNSSLRDDLHPVRCKSEMFIRKSNNVTKSLHKLYSKKYQRKVGRETLMEYVRKDNEKLLQKTRVYFKDSEATQNLEKILASTEEDNNSENRNENNKPETSIPLTDRNVSAQSRDSRLESSASDSSDDTCSTAAQLSDSEDWTSYRPRILDTNTIPEMWKILHEKQRNLDVREDRQPLLVTITARYRRSLVN